jgi:endonuclease/exonuclease/phosphatase family metal-dependent hydrolase
LSENLRNGSGGHITGFCKAGSCDKIRLRGHFGISSLADETRMRHKEDLRIRVATYNVHKCRGLDGRTSPQRIASVLESLRADVIALQEVIGGGPRGTGQEEKVASCLGMQSFLCPARRYRGHLYGNAVLTRLPVGRHFSYDLSENGFEPRFCQRVEILVRKYPLQIYNVHLGTSRRERGRQAERLIRILADTPDRSPKIILGDFNEWRKGAATETLGNNLRAVDLIPFLRWPRTFPGLLPLFHLDHIYFSGPLEVERIEIRRRLRSFLASDHLPLVAELRIGGSGTEGYGDPASGPRI